MFVRMHILCANFKFKPFAVPEILMVAKPINSTLGENCGKNLKNSLVKPINSNCYYSPLVSSHANNGFSVSQLGIV